MAHVPLGRHRVKRITSVMSTAVPGAGSSGVLSIRETAWILGVDASEVCRLIRVGVLPTIRRRSRLVVPAHAVALLLSTSGQGRAR
jgi:hypothetical protein